MAEKFKRDVSTPIELVVEVDNVNTIYAWAKASTKPTYTKSEVGLGNVDNTSDAAKSVLSATKLSANRTITLSGDVTGSVLTDFSGNPTISTTVVDDSHNHIISNVDGLQTALDGKLATTANAVSATKLQTARTISLNGDLSGSALFDGSTNITISSTVSDNSHNHDNSTIVPLASKTYTGVYATANDFASGTFYFASVRPTSFTIPYHIKYRIHSSVPSYSDYSGYFDVDFWGCQSSRLTYACFNNHYNFSYRSLFYHTWYTLTSTGYTNGYGHGLGIGLQNSVNPTNATYARTFIVEILEAQNCAVTMYDTMKLYSALDGTGATNFSGYGEYNGSNNGLMESGDDNNFERLMLVNDRYLAGTNSIYGSQLVMQKANGTWESLTSTYSTGTTKTKNASGFLPNKIVFYTSGTTVTSGNNIATVTVYSNIPNYEFRYSSNCGTTLTPYRSVYLKGSISNGLFYLADVWYSQTLPTSDDGYVYIYLGESYSTSTINLDTEHPMYAFKGGTIQTIIPYALTAPSSAILTWDGE